MKLISFKENGLKFDNGTFIEDYHRQDCCESVYADWDQLKDTDVLSHEFKDKIEIEKVEGSGFKIEGYFIPCYNYQNGYYGSDLELHIIYPNKEKEIVDLNVCIEDHFD